MNSGAPNKMYIYFKYCALPFQNSILNDFILMNIICYNIIYVIQSYWFINEIFEMKWTSLAQIPWISRIVNLVVNSLSNKPRFLEFRSFSSYKWISSSLSNSMREKTQWRSIIWNKTILSLGSHLSVRNEAFSYVLESRPWLII